jgi:SAM-dependent methyltransferase
MKASFARACRPNRNPPPCRAVSEIDIQRQYYAKTAEAYDVMHVADGDEHFFALSLLLASIDFLGVRSVLDIGSGTGRAVAAIRNARPSVVVKGVEPVAELREVAYRSGIARDEIVEGDALALQFEPGQYDLVCEFGVLHHIRSPDRAVREMLRVANKAVFISDSNNFGQGGTVGRALKQAANALKLWPVVDFVKTRGRGYTISAGDGLAYSYSVFNNYEQIRAHCESVHLLNTTPAGVNPYRTASHVALLGIKRPAPGASK